MMKKYQSVWDALEGSREEAANMKVRAELMITLQERVKRQAGSQVEKAEKLGLSQPRLNTIVPGILQGLGKGMHVNRQVGLSAVVIALTATLDGCGTTSSFDNLLWKVWARG